MRARACHLCIVDVKQASTCQATSQKTTQLNQRSVRVFKQLLPNLTCRTSPSSSAQREKACKWECTNLCCPSCTARNLLACWQSKQFANTPSTPRKAHHQESVMVLDLELEQASEQVMEKVLAPEMEQVRDLDSAMNQSLDTVSCCFPCRCCLNQ